MYNLYLACGLDKLLILNSKSQKEIDKFLTNFDDEKDFLDRFELDESKELVYEKSSKKGNEKVPFLYYKYKDLFSSIDNYYYFLQVSNYNRNIIGDYFVNEECKYINSDNPFLKNKYKICNNIKNKASDNEYSNYKLAKLMELYFNGLYSNFKLFYMYLIDNGFTPKMKPFIDEKYDETFDMIEKRIIEKPCCGNISGENIMFDESLEEINYILSKNIDIDKKMSELDMLSDKFNDEKKLKLINNNWL